jgi:uncharacterized membrane protein YfcA
MALRVAVLIRMWGVRVGVAACALLGYFTLQRTIAFLLLLVAPLLVILFLDERAKRGENTGPDEPTDLQSNWALIVVSGLFMGLIAGVWVDH